MYIKTKYIYNQYSVYVAVNVQIKYYRLEYIIDINLSSSSNYKSDWVLELDLSIFVNYLGILVGNHVGGGFSQKSTWSINYLIPGT
jgi:hypothetical protein